jgi:hypothetical protein
MAAVHDVGVESNERVETAWHHAWLLLLSEVLADEALSPFASPAARGAGVSR